MWTLGVGKGCGKMPFFSVSSGINAKPYGLHEYKSLWVTGSGAVGKAFPCDSLWEEGVSGIKRRKGTRCVELWLFPVRSGDQKGFSRHEICLKLLPIKSVEL